MKKSILMLIATVAMVVASCKENSYIPSPGDTTYVPDTMPVMIPDTSGIEISVDSAIAICNALPDNGVTSEVYKIRGMVVANTTHPFEVPGKQNINFSISDNGNLTNLACYYIKNVNNLSFNRPSQVPLSGSRLTLVGNLTKFVSKSGKKTPEIKDGFIVSIDSLVSLSFNGCPKPQEGEISVNQAKAISDSIGDGKTTSQSYKIRGVVITKDLPSDADLKSYGNFTFSITSEGETYAICYRIKGKNNGKFTANNQLEIGDTILVNAKIQNYNGTCEPVQGYVAESSNPNF